MANLLRFALMSLRHFRATHPETFIAVGGVGAAGVEREVVQLCPWIDAVEMGEGRLALARSVTDRICVSWHIVPGYIRVPESRTAI